jgi:hypothetical protein
VSEVPTSAAAAPGDPLRELFVNTAAAALSRIRTSAVHAATMGRQLALTRAAKALTESLDLGTLLGRICEEAIALLDADNAAVYHGTAEDGFKVGGVAGLPPEFVGWPLAPGTGLAGQVVERERPMLTNNYESVVALPPDSPFKRVTAALAVPFGWDDELRGVLSVGWERPHRVGGDDLTVLEANAIPGLTDTSLLPLAAEAAGITFDAFVARVLDLALARASAAA